MVADIDAIRRLTPDVLTVLDAIVEMTQGRTDRVLTGDEVARYIGTTPEAIRGPLTRLVGDVRRLRGLEMGADGTPERFALVYVPQGDAYAAYRALIEPRDAAADGCAPRAAMEAWQGRWPELAHVDFDAGLAELADRGWAERCSGEPERWQLTSRGIHLGRTRLGGS